MPMVGLTKRHSDLGCEPHDCRFAAIMVVVALLAFCHNKGSFYCGPAVTRTSNI
jgi:hypothetical protein